MILPYNSIINDLKHLFKYSFIHLVDKIDTNEKTKLKCYIHCFC